MLFCSWKQMFHSSSYILRRTFYLLQDGDSHIEVMVLHGGGGVDRSQGRRGVHHELVVKAPVVQVVTDGSHPQAQTLVWSEDIWRGLTTIINHG